MFTQLNQYHVVLEVKPSFGQRPLNLSDLYIRSGMTSAASGVVSATRRVGNKRDCSRRPSTTAPGLAAAVRTGGIDNRLS